MSEQPFEVTCSQHDGVTVASLAGEIDVATAPLAQAELEAVAPPGGRLVVDLSDVPFADSAGIRLLDRTLGWCRSRDTAVRFVVPDATQLRYLLRITAFPEDVLSADLASALADLS
jgi:anti-sigma B factor antagonist